MIGISFLIVTNVTAQKLTLPMATLNQYFDLSQQDITYHQQQYRLFIAVPKIQRSHKLFFLLDANAQFPIALSKIDTTKPLPLIVGIGYITDKDYAVPERTRDYTFPAVGEEFAKGGKAEDFLNFIVTQVLPTIHQQYQIKKSLFFGHSFGGLFGLYTLFTRTHTFDDYVLASPSLWWGNGSITQYWTNKDQQPHSVTLTIGEYEQNPSADPNIDPERLARIKQRRQQLRVENVNQQFLIQQWNSKLISIPKTNHGSSIPFAIEIAIRKIQSD